MAFDLYQPCPCGSGKKLKFCCANIADDMLRVDRLIDDHQLRGALTLLETLEKKVQPGSSSQAWIGTTKATVHLQAQRPELAKTELAALLEQHPDNDYAYCLFAMASLATDSYEPSRKVIQKAFFRCARKFPAMCSHLAIGVATVMLSRGSWMAAREAMALALRMASEEERQGVFMRLLEIDNNRSIPWPLRSTHYVPKFQGTEEQDKTYIKGQKFIQLGCFEAAAECFTQLTQQISDDPAPWHAAGLARTWDGMEADGATNLHEAAKRYTDRATAVECETIAQLLELNSQATEITYGRQSLKVESVSRLLTTLDGHDRLDRLEIPQEAAEAPIPPVAIYRIYDRSLKETILGTGEPKIADLPAAIGQIVIYDAVRDSGEGPFALIDAYLDGDMQAAVQLVKEAAGDQITVSEEAPTPEAAVPPQWKDLQRMRFYPERIGPSVRRRLDREVWDYGVRNSWLKNPWVGLNGKSPTEAASDSSLNIPLTAAVYALDSFAAQLRRPLNTAAIMKELNVEPLPPLEVTAETPLTNLSVMDFHRLPIEQLTDEQVLYAFNRALVIQHPDFLHRVQLEAVKRPACLEKIDQRKVFLSLADGEVFRDRIPEALHWIAELRKLPAPQGQNEFATALQNDMNELTIRTIAPEVPGLDELINKFVTYYVPKLPDIKPVVEQMCRVAGKPSPWATGAGLVTDVAGGSVTSGGLWSPGKSEPVAAGGSKLWLPGQ